MLFLEVGRGFCLRGVASAFCSLGGIGCPSLQVFGRGICPWLAPRTPFWQTVAKSGSLANRRLQVLSFKSLRTFLTALICKESQDCHALPLHVRYGKMFDKCLMRSSWWIEPPHLPVGGVADAGTRRASAAASSVGPAPGTLIALRLIHALLVIVPERAASENSRMETRQ